MVKLSLYFFSLIFLFASVAQAVPIITFPLGGGGGGGGLTDGDKGDISVSGSGTIWSIDSGAIIASDLASGVVPTISGDPNAVPYIDEFGDLDGSTCVFNPAQPDILNCPNGQFPERQARETKCMTVTAGAVTAGELWFFPLGHFTDTTPTTDIGVPWCSCANDSTAFGNPLDACSATVALRECPASNRWFGSGGNNCFGANMEARTVLCDSQTDPDNASQSWTGNGSIASGNALWLLVDSAVPAGTILTVCLPW